VLLSLQVNKHELNWIIIIIIIIFSWVETESTLYCLAYCTSRRREMMIIVEQSVEWELAGETEVLEKKPAPVSLCPPQILHDLIRARTRWEGDD
jgi:hypothetical protein